MKDIYNNKVIGDRSYMQASNTRVVTIELCGNDYLQARSNFHLDGAGSSFDYLQSDNTHPTYYTSATIGLNWFTGSGSGSGAPTYQDGSIVGGKNPQWNRHGHERMGWSISTYLPATP